MNSNYKLLGSILFSTQNYGMSSVENSMSITKKTFFPIDWFFFFFFFFWFCIELSYLKFLNDVLTTEASGKTYLPKLFSSRSWQNLCSICIWLDAEDIAASIIWLDCNFKPFILDPSFVVIGNTFSSRLLF